MTHAREISGSELAVILRRSGRSDPAIVMAEIYLDAHDADLFHVGMVQRAFLVDTYKRRLEMSSRKGDALYELARLLDDFVTAADEQLRLITLDDPSGGIGVWLAADEDRLVACYSGVGAPES